MLYDRIEGRIRPFHEDGQGYIFRYFCGDDPVPHEQSLPKSGPHYVCGCRALMVVEEDSEGPYLGFGESEQHHFGAQPRPR
jgi:hypothetical protein